MFKFSVLFAALLSLTSLTVLTGCVNTPTQKVQVVDDRPLIMFAAAKPGDVVVLDGIEMGTATQFSAGKTGLRIESGTHRLQIKRAGETILSQKFYVAEGISKTFTIGEY